LELVKHYSGEIDCGAYRVSDPYSFDTDPDLDPIRIPDPIRIRDPDTIWIPVPVPIRIQVFFPRVLMTKKEKNLEVEKKIFFLIKNYNLPIPRPT
jgi:hypothetical protein